MDPVGKNLLEIKFWFMSYLKRWFLKKMCALQWV